MTGTERKVLNKYYPPDFDPRKIPKGRFEPNRQYVIRVMAPFNMQCNTCGEYIYKGKKFNARRETVQDDDYLGLSLFRFYIRCPRCLAEITFKTDLKNCDYSQEHGSTRLFEAEKLLKQEEQKIQQQEDEDKTNPMKMLEKRTKMSRFEMDALERLEELKDMNQRKLKPDYESIIDEITKEQQLARERQEKEDEDFVNAIFGKTEDGKVLKRIIDDEEDDPNLPVCSKTQKNPKERDKNPPKKPKFSNQKSILSSAIVKKSSQIAKNDDEICVKKEETEVKQEKSIENLHKDEEKLLKNEEKLSKNEEKVSKIEEKLPKNSLNLLSAYANSSDSD